MQRKQAISKVPAKKETDYHKKGCFAADFIAADKKGEVIIPKPGETTLQAVKRYLKEKNISIPSQKKPFSIRLPIYVADAAKAQAKAAGMKYTSYLAKMIERAVKAA